MTIQGCWGQPWGVLVIQKIHMTQNNWKIMSIFYSLATRALYFLKKGHKMAIFPVLGKLTHMHKCRHFCIIAKISLQVIKSTATIALHCNDFVSFCSGIHTLNIKNFIAVLYPIRIRVIFTADCDSSSHQAQCMWPSFFASAFASSKNHLLQSFTLLKLMRRAQQRGDHFIFIFIEKNSSHISTHMFLHIFHWFSDSVHIHVCHTSKKRVFLLCFLPKLD